MELIHQIEFGGGKITSGLEQSQTVTSIADNFVQAQFSKAIQQQQTITSYTDNSQSLNTITEPADSDAIIQQKLSKSLEALIVSMMMKPMFAEFAESTFGKGVEADVYTYFIFRCSSRCYYPTRGQWIG